jgi:hypothetical protein
MPISYWLLIISLRKTTHQTIDSVQCHRQLRLQAAIKATTEKQNNNNKKKKKPASFE